MSVPAYTVHSSRPRLFFRSTDRTALVNRTDNAAIWKTAWDSIIVPAADTYKGRTAQGFIETYNAHIRMMVLAFVGYIEETTRTTNGYRDKAIKGAVYLAGTSDGVNPTVGRYRLLALAIAFDLLYDSMTDTERNTIAAEMAIQCDRMTARSDEYIDGHSGNDQMCQMAGALTGYGHGSIDWQTRLTEAMRFWYGPTDSTSDGRIETPRYACTDGGYIKGSWYTYLGQWCEFWQMWMLANGTNLTPWTTETAWASKIWEWYIWTSMTGGSTVDFEAQGDTHRLTNPLFRMEHRWALAMLATMYPESGGYEGGKHLRWIYDQYYPLDSYADDIVFDIIFLNKSSTPPVAPSAAAVVPATSRMFSPPGVYYYRTSWDYDNSVSMRISGRELYDLGHRHLDSGSVQLTFKGDRVLLAPAGIYRGDKYGTDHHINALQRSWLQSMCPLIYDSSQVYQWWSTTCDNDGGQHYKKYLGASDVGNVFNWQNDGGGQAWDRTEFTSSTETDNGIFIVADLRPGYKKEYTDVDRFPILKSKFLVIKPTVGNGLTYPALLVYIRISKTNRNWRTMIPLHSYNAWTLTSYGAHTTGYYGVGKLWVDIRSVGDYTLTNQTPGTPLDSLGYGPDQWKNPFTGTSHAPDVAPTTIELPDMKRHSLYAEKTLRTDVEDYVVLLMPTGVGDAEPASGRAWVPDTTNPDYYGIVIGTSTYYLHRTLNTVLYEEPPQPPDPPDPPDPPPVIVGDESDSIPRGATTAVVGAEYLTPGQAKPEVLVNEGWNRFDPTSRLTVKGRATATPPAAVAGDRYIVPTSPTGAWVGHEKDVACYYGGWLFITPREGWEAWVDDENCTALYNGVDWVVAGPVADLSQSITNPPTQTEVETIQAKINELIVELRETGVLKT